MIYAFENAQEISQKIKYHPLPSWDEIAKKQENFYFKVIGRLLVVRSVFVGPSLGHFGLIAGRDIFLRLL